MWKAVDFHDRDVVIAQQFHDPLDEFRHQQRHVTARYVRDLDGSRQRLQPGAQSFERSAVLACWGNFAELIGGVIFIGWVFYGLGAAAIFPIRKAEEGKAIPYRVPGYPWTPIVFVLAAGAIVANAIYSAVRDPSQFKNLVVAIVLFGLGVPAYFFWRKQRATA